MNFFLTHVNFHAGGKWGWYIENSVRNAPPDCGSVNTRSSIESVAFVYYYPITKEILLLGLPPNSLLKQCSS